MAHYTRGNVEYGSHSGTQTRQTLTDGEALYIDMYSNGEFTIYNNNTMFHYYTEWKFGSATEWNYSTEGNSTSLQSYKDEYIIATIPIFNHEDRESIRKYIENGDISGAINYDDICYGKKYFDIYIDGTDRPNITLGCTVENDVESCPFTCKIYIDVFYGDSSTLDVYRKELLIGQSCAVNFDSLVASANFEWYQKLLYSVNNIFDNVGLHITAFINKSDGTQVAHGVLNITRKAQTDIKIEDELIIRINKNSDGEDAENDGYTNPDLPSDKDNGETPIDTVGLLTSTYVLTNDKLTNIANKLWDSSFIDNIKLVNNNPIENVCSVKMLPIKVSGEEKEVYIGNVNFGINGEKISSNYSPWYSERKTISLKSDLPIWANYAPFTKMSIYLPYIGYKELDVNRFMGRSIQVKYIVDVLTGMCKAVILNDLGKVISFDGNCGVDIPLTASNKAQHDFAYLQSVIGGIASVASKDVIGATMNVQNAISNPFTSQTSGCNTPTCSSNEGNVIALYIDYPHIQYPSTFAKEKGLPCNISLVLKKCGGFTKVASNNIDLSGIPCLDEEKERLRNILTSGFIANW